jgi:hypothetical protein
MGGSILRKQFDPCILEQAVSYLWKRFDSDVESAWPESSYSGSVADSPAVGARTRARVDGCGLMVRWKGESDAPPILEGRYAAKR